MGKTYIDTVKYLIYSEIEVDGLVDKPDVVGAIFGQTEGLLGDDLDLRELQKNGRIGRIDVDLNSRGGKTYGMVKVPSSLDMVETSIIAASLEIVDRIGPCDGRVRVQKIEDTRSQKRKVLVERAKNLLKNMLSTEIPESKEISEMVRDQVKSSEVSEYGPEKLACGPSIEKVEEIMLVEGRADVINLLKNDITNVIAIGGARVPRSVVELSKGKEVTVFLDGDRGGDIILNELSQGGVEIDFVARAPVGKEVEELTRKEIIKVLRNKVPFDQIDGQKSKPFAQSYQTRRYVAEQPTQVEERKPEPQPMPQRREREMREEPRRQFAPAPSVKPIFERIQQIIAPQEAPEPKRQEPRDEPRPQVAKKSTEELMSDLNELSNTLKARVYIKDGVFAREVPVRDVIKTIEELPGVETVVFDGIITQRLVDIASAKGVKTLIGVRLGNVTKKPDEMHIVTKSK
ncbi:MAG: DNA primase DnaG [Candidatus ainarchaeum sp.]|nr:DNA primase DnaG [Candidatus ainarchaeum sp.]